MKMGTSDSIIISEEILAEDQTFLGLSSVTPEGKNIAIFDYDNYAYSNMPYGKGPWKKLVEDNFIWLQTSSQNYQLIIPVKLNTDKLIDLFRKLEPCPCPINFANGLRKGEWVSRITPKRDKPSDIRVKDMFIRNMHYENVSLDHVRFYLAIQKGEKTSNLNLKFVSYKRYFRYEYEII